MTGYYSNGSQSNGGRHVSSAIHAPEPGNYEGTSPVHNVIPNIGNLPIDAALASIPSAEQIVSRQADSTTTPTNASVRTAAPSSLSGLLLVTTGSTTTDRTLTTTMVDPAARGDSLDDLLQAIDSTTQDAQLSMSAVDRERQAVDAVLSELHDFSLPIDIQRLASGDDQLNEPIAVDLRRTLGEDSAAQSLATAEGGMVMLEARGDANDGVFNLIGAAGERTELAEHIDISHARAGVEIAVGFYQAMDVATHEAPAANLQTATPAAVSAKTVEPATTDRHMLERKAGTSPKTATVAASLLGALLWVNRSGSRETKRDEPTTAEKRPRQLI
jgi:hypothetical protein